MRITSKGQVTIPGDIRERFGFQPDTEVDFVVKGGTVYLKRSPAGARRGNDLIRHMRGKGTVKMTTDEIMALTRKDK